MNEVSGHSASRGQEIKGQEIKGQEIKGQEHWTNKGPAKLFLWEKRAPGGPKNGTILFVHGSSMASQPTFDLDVPGRPNSSAMQTRNHTGKLLVYGISSGALRAALFAQRHPNRVRRLALDAHVWTGEGSPTLVERRKKLPEYLKTKRRPINRAFVRSIFERDHPGTADDKVIEVFADRILELDDSIPNGTYIDMCNNLPVVDPTQIKVPTIVMRGEYDGIAGFKDLLNFFEALPNPDKQFAVMPGIAHASLQQKNYMVALHILHSFFSQPEPIYSTYKG